jgi:hypothetical protein
MRHSENRADLAAQLLNALSSASFRVAPSPLLPPPVLAA